MSVDPFSTQRTVHRSADYGATTTRSWYTPSGPLSRSR